jgi:hypothetical protein
MSDAAAFYLAVVFVVNVVAFFFSDPRKGTIYKYIYWLLVPIIDIVCMGLLFKSIVGGLAMGAMAIVSFTAMYYRYRD